MPSNTSEMWVVALGMRNPTKLILTSWLNFDPLLYSLLIVYLTIKFIILRDKKERGFMINMMIDLY